MANQIPIVDYLVLDDGDPHLEANECTKCGALFWDRRNACGRCANREFTDSFRREMQALSFICGANSIFSGDKLLTTANPGNDHDEMLKA